MKLEVSNFFFSWHEIVKNRALKKHSQSYSRAKEFQGCRKECSSNFNSEENYDPKIDF